VRLGVHQLLKILVKGLEMVWRARSLVLMLVPLALQMVGLRMERTPVVSCFLAARLPTAQMALGRRRPWLGGRVVGSWAVGDTSFSSSSPDKGVLASGELRSGRVLGRPRPILEVGDGDGEAGGTDGLAGQWEAK